MTPATDAAREARAREIAWKLVIGEKVGGGDGQTYVGRTPTVREIEAALLAFADTEAASQPREGEIRCPACHVKFRKIEDVDAHLVALIQRPPEQAGAVPAGIDVTAMVSEALGDHQCGNRPALKRRLIADIRAALSAALTPPDAGIGSDGAGERYERALRNIEAGITGRLRDWEGSERGDAFSLALSIVQTERAALATQSGDGGQS